jgi:hypothetical protein
MAIWSRASSTFSRRWLRYGTRTIVEFVNVWLPIPENAPQRPINPSGRSKLAGEQIIGPTFAISFFLSSFTISWRDCILTSFLSNLRSFLIKKNSYSWPHLQKQIDVPRVSADQDGPALGGH